jgi:hypothetical protein
MRNNFIFESQIITLIIEVTTASLSLNPTRQTLPRQTILLQGFPIYQRYLRDGGDRSILKFFGNLSISRLELYQKNFLIRFFITNLNQWKKLYSYCNNGRRIRKLIRAASLKTSADITWPVRFKIVGWFSRTRPITRMAYTG